jgi:hypothetical protein
MIRTIPKRGYVLEADARPSASASPPRRRFAVTPVRLAAAAILILVATIAIIRFHPGEDRTVVIKKLLPPPHLTST